MVRCGAVLGGKKDVGERSGGMDARGGEWGRLWVVGCVVR